MLKNRIGLLHDRIPEKPYGQILTESGGKPLRYSQQPCKWIPTTTKPWWSKKHCADRWHPFKTWNYSAGSEPNGIGLLHLGSFEFAAGSKVTWTDGVVAEIITTTGSVESDHYKTMVVLTEAMENPGFRLSPRIIAVVESVKTIESDHYITVVLNDLLKTSLPMKRSTRC